MRVIIMLVNTAILIWQPFFLREVAWGFKPFDFVGIALAAAMGAVFVGASWVHAVRLAKEGK
jgi:hypothetical protein